MSVKAFIFDFDGLILDSETPVYEAWQKVFNNFGIDLPFSIWQKSVGSSKEAFDPILYLEEKIGKQVDRKQLDQNQRICSYSDIFKKPLLPGVLIFLEHSKERGIKLAIASSSSTDWVYCNLIRLDIVHLFDVICCGDEVLKTKPDPDLFLLAANLLGVNPAETIVFEDSPNGISAANAAKMYCVAIPNPVTKSMVINHANLVVNSLADLPVDKLLTDFNNLKQE